jgi:LPS O-antigen subunit length determinant protein (WzzB/FepE family)
MITEKKQRANVDEIDLSAIFAILWKRRVLIVLGTLAMTLLAIGISFFIPKVYRSEGFYQLGHPKKTIIEVERTTTESEKTTKESQKTILKNKAIIGIPIPLYKKSSTQFFNPDRLQLFANQEKSFSAKELKNITGNFRIAADIIKWVKPVYAYSREDVREFAQVGKDEINSVIGLNLSYEADSPQKAYAYVRFFGKYIRDCLMYVSLYDYVMNEYSDIISGLNQNDNDIIDIKFKLLQNSKKMLDIKAILSKYPESAKIENRQLVSVQEGGSRFLAPVTQLVGIESTMAELNQQLTWLERERKELAIQREFFSQSNAAFNNLGKKGEMMFEKLKAIKSEMFKKMDFRLDTVKGVANKLSIDFQAFDLAFYTNCRFISGPTLPVQHIKPRKSIIVLVAFFLSAFFFLLLAFSLSWW